MPYPSYEEFRKSEEKTKKTSRVGKFFVTLLKVLVTIVVIVVFSLEGYDLYKKYYINPRSDDGIYSILVDKPVKTFRDNIQSWEETAEFELTKGDILVTGNTARTVLGFKDCASIRVAPMSRIKYKSLKDGVLTLGIEEGKLWLESWSGKYKIISNHGTVSMQDAAIQVIAGGSPPLRLYCYSGSARVETTAFQNNKISLNQDQKIYVSEKNEISSPSPLQANYTDPWEQWNASFSGKSLSAAEVPAGYTFNVTRQEGKNVYTGQLRQQGPRFRMPNNRQGAPQPPSPPSPFPRISKNQQYQQNNSQNYSNKDGEDYPKYQPRRKRQGMDNKMPPPPGQGPGGSGGERVPSIDNFDNLPGAPLSKGGSGGANQSNSKLKYVQSRERDDNEDDEDDEEEEENYEKPDKEKHQDAYDILSNKSKRNKTDGRTAPPGFGINDEPVSADGGT